MKTRIERVMATLQGGGGDFFMTPYWQTKGSMMMLRCGYEREPWSFIPVSE